jgi:plasmid stabilization system protein ParE
MKNYEIILLPAAYSDLDEIFDFILAKNPAAAGRTLDKIMNSLRRLEDLPLSGAPLLERSLWKYEFKMVLIDPYLAFYRFIDNKVYVYRILHGARDYRHLLQGLFPADTEKD